jgi:phosphoglycerate dehydrogenase-like enzyme
MSKPRIAILDDTQGVALTAADWSTLRERAEIEVFPSPFASEDETISALSPFDIVVPMRERTPFPRALLARLPKLRMIALTGARAPSLDLVACADFGITVSNTGGDYVTAATAELTWGLILACARGLPRADAGVRQGGWHDNLTLGTNLQGKRIGIVGLGKLGARVARYASAFGMEVVAWSQNLTEAAAAECGARRVDKNELFSTSDVITLHLVLSERTRGIVGHKEMESLKPGCILINTARGPLIEEEALLGRLRQDDIVAGLDVFDKEPLPEKSPFRMLCNVVIAPHLGYSTREVIQQFYGESVENITAFLDGEPIRVITPRVDVIVAR